MRLSKGFKLKINLINIIYTLIFVLLFILIMNRTSFDFKSLSNFYKINEGYQKTIIINDRFYYQALEMKYLIKKYKIMNFNITKKLFEIPIFEAVYPARYSKKSKFFFSDKDEKIENCNILEEREKIKLLVCK